MQNIREYVTGKKIYVSTDESTDTKGRYYVANVIVGTLKFDKPGTIFLLTSEVLQKVDHSNICVLFAKSMSLLWPNEIQHEDVLLFITDATPYMIKAAKSIKDFYPRMMHATYLATWFA